jgi:hypothetical protein
MAMLNRPGAVRIRAFLCVLGVLGVLGVRVAVGAGVAIPAPALPHLNGIDELKSWFNANKGHTRLVLLLSPT